MHPDERKWAKDNAAKFAALYEDKTGLAITAEQAENMLLANGYRLVDAYASKGPGGDTYAINYINENGGGLFAKDQYYNDPFKFGNKDGSLTPEQRALPGAIANPKAGLAIAGGLVTAGLAPEIAAGLASVSGAPIFSSGGALGSAALASPVGTGAISAGISAGSQYLQNGSINPVDLAGAFGTGVAGSYGRLLWNVGVNAFGSATTTAINNPLQGKNDSIVGSAITSGVLSSFGYGAGKLGEYIIGNAIKPTISNAQNWVATDVWSGSGWNFINANNLPVIVGTGVGGLGQEISNKIYDSIKSNLQNKK